MSWFSPKQSPKREGAKAARASAPFVSSVEGAPAPPPVEFHRHVETGYLDSAGRWYRTEHEADYASARSHLIERINATRYRGFGAFRDPSPQEIIEEADFIRAMAILGTSPFSARPDDIVADAA